MKFNIFLMKKSLWANRVPLELKRLIHPSINTLFVEKYFSPENKNNIICSLEQK